MKQVIMKDSAGVTFIELIILITIVGFLVIGIGFYGGVCRGNFWVSEKSALKAVQIVSPTIVSIHSLERHIWGYSKVVAIDKDGSQKTFKIDANVLQNRRAIAK